MSSYHLTERNIPHYISKLRKYRPDFIDSYPSSLYTVALYCKKNGIDLKGITKKVVTSAEMLFPEQREVIEDVFDLVVNDQYGAAEMCAFVGQCQEGNYHIYNDYSILEFLREDGSTASAGEEAEIVCTSLINPVMPFIRYRIGDRGILSDIFCKCGNPFPVVGKLLGRMDDVIITPEGRRVGRLSPVLKGFPIKESQYIQNEKESVEVLIVKASDYTNMTEKMVVHELRKRLGNRIRIKIKYVAHIPRGAGGKQKNIISTVSHQMA